MYFNNNFVYTLNKKYHILINLHFIKEPSKQIQKKKRRRQDSNLRGQAQQISSLPP